MNITRENSNERRVYEKIKGAIIHRKIAPGHQLVESVIAKNMGISRTPVRGALKKLAAEGLVEMFFNRGAYVAQPDQKEIKEAYFMREKLETIALKGAVDRFGEDDLAYLSDLIRQEKKAVKDRDFETYLEINERFHLYPAQKQGNAFLVDFLKTLMSRISLYLVLYDVFFARPPTEVRSVGDHENMVKLYKKKDLAGLKEQAAEHNRTSLQDLAMMAKEYRSLSDLLAEEKDRTKEQST